MVTRLKKRIEVGNIATYEDASQEFLTRRKEDLRAGMRNPHLSIGEFIRSIAMRAGLTMFIAGWGVWNGVETIITRSPGLNKGLTRNNGQNRYIHDVSGFSSYYDETTREISRLLFSGSEASPDEVTAVLDKMIDHATHFNLKAGTEEIKALKARFEANPSLTITQKTEEVFTALKNLRTANPHSGIGQYATLWEETDAIRQRAQDAGHGIDYVGLAAQAFNNKRDEVIEKAVLRDNKLIINRWRMPLLGVAVLGGGALAGVGTYRAALRDKALSQESELSHIERLERERRHAAQKDKGTAEPGATLA
ncbi:MAG: hypothetical protein WDN72_08635 [Alphaproteobacteria bacterium]